MQWYLVRFFLGSPPATIFWQGLGDISVFGLTGPKPRDAAALPHSGTAHEYRNANELWGHKAFRLVPVVYIGLGMKGMVLVHEEDSKVQLRVRPGLLLDWYEGLLVLDALSRNAEPCGWLENLAVRLQKEKATRKLSASLYVSKKLLHTAVTGPQFVTREASRVFLVFSEKVTAATCLSYCWWLRNPVNSPVEVGSLIPSFTGFFNEKYLVVRRMSSINTSTYDACQLQMPGQDGGPSPQASLRTSSIAGWPSNWGTRLVQGHAVAV